MITVLLVLTPFGVAIIATIIDQRLAYRAYDMAASLGDAPPKHWRWLNIREFAFWDHMLNLAKSESSAELTALLRRHNTCFTLRILGVVGAALGFVASAVIQQ